MSDKLKNSIERIIPPGANAKQPFSFCIRGIVIGIIFNLFLFWSRYTSAFLALYEYEDGVRVRTGDMMTDFYILYDGTLVCFLAFVVAVLGFMAYYYSYYYQGSKSIYLMRRLPSRFELHKRALTTPIIMCAVFIISAFILTLINFGLYMLITPNNCILPYQWQKLWGNIL